MTKEELNHCLELCYQWKKKNPNGDRHTMNFRLLLWNY